VDPDLSARIYSQRKGYTSSPCELTNEREGSAVQWALYFEVGLLEIFRTDIYLSSDDYFDFNTIDKIMMQIV